MTVHRTTPRFWKNYNELPKSIQNKADKQYTILKNNPKHPSLHFKSVGEYWSARVNLDYRALAVKDEEGYIWVWIGNHTDYDKLLN